MTGSDNKSLEQMVMQKQLLNCQTNSGIVLVQSKKKIIEMLGIQIKQLKIITAVDSSKKRLKTPGIFNN